MKSRKLLIALIAAIILFASIVFAAKFGGMPDSLTTWLNHKDTKVVADIPYQDILDTRRR